jgi:hypothetical protein
MIKELKIIVRAHYGVSQGLCPLCAQSSQGARTGEHPHNPVCQLCYPWLRRYADFLENLATRLEGMPDWLPRSN